MPSYYVTALRGLEPIVRQEIAARLPGATVQVEMPVGEWGRIAFDYGGPPARALDLRSVENVFAAVDEAGGVPTGETGLEVIRARLAATDLEPARQVHAALHGERSAPTFRCTSKRVGEHAFGSMQIMAAAGAGVVDRYGWKVNLEEFDYDLHVDLAGDRLYVGLRLTPLSLHHRSRIVHAPASLNPTLGYAMCVLSDPQPGEVFLDPTCGAGTVTIERAALGPARLLAGDLSPHAVDLARRNFAAFSVDADLCRWDARRLPLRSESIDKLCANLPWGRRAGSHTSNQHLYPGFVREIARVLRVGGLAVVLSLERQLLTRLVDRHGWLRFERNLRISVGGLHPALHVIRKHRGQDLSAALPADRCPLPVPCCRH